jgi:ketosteroid isomerase-like protein
MSEQNVEIIRRAAEAADRGDFDAVVADFAADSTYISSGAIPGTEPVYRGPEGFKRFLHWLWDEFDEPHVEIHELIGNDDRVLLAERLRGRGKRSGIEVSWFVWQVFTIRDGTVVHGQAFTDRSEALEAAGLSE